MPEKRHWRRADQIRSERPKLPATATCATHPGRHVVIRWRGAAICLLCVGCPRCGLSRSGTPQVWSEIDDSGLLYDPIVLDGYKIRGDWSCLTCGEKLADWTTYRRAMLGWKLMRRAEAEGYKRRDEAA